VENQFVTDGMPISAWLRLQEPCYRQ